MTALTPDDLAGVVVDIMTYLDSLTSRLEARHGSDVTALVATAMTSALVTTMLDMACLVGPEQVKRTSGALHRVIDEKTAGKLAEMLSERVREINER